MKRLIILCLVILGAILFFSIPDTMTQGIQHSKIKTTGVTTAPIPDYATIPLYFIPNEGQVHEEAAFYAKTSAYTLWMTKKGLIFDSTRKALNSDKKTERDVSRLAFLNTDKTPGMVPLEFTSHTVNYIKGNNPSMWRTDIQTSKAVMYTNLYNNIDLKVYGIEKQIEYDWIVKPGGNPADIRFKYSQVKGTRIDEHGNLIIETQFGELTHKRPAAYQEKHTAPKPGGKPNRVKVDAKFKKLGENTYGFEVGPYDKTRELVIDPVVLVYSTYLGGTGDEHGFGLAVSTHGRAFLTGDTYSTDFPTESAYQNSSAGGNRDAFVIRFSSSGTPVFSTYLGGSGDDTGSAIQVDADGDVYVTGFTYSSDFPIKNAFQTSLAGDRDTIVCKLSPSGDSLEYSSYLGGSAADEGFSIALDSSNNMYVTGRTYSSDFPTLTPFQRNFGGGNMDAFVTKISSAGANLLYSTYLGGKGDDTGYGLAVDGNNAYVAGRTSSTNFPVHNEIQGTYGGGLYDGFVTKLASAGSSLVYSTYLGGGGTDSGYGVAVDDAGNAYVTGDTAGSGFPIKNAFQETYGGGEKDAFITWISPSAELLYSTYFGGKENDQAAVIALDDDGNIYFAGSTRSSDFPLRRAFQTSYSGDFDAFVSMLSPDGASLELSTYLGGSEDDSARGIGIDKSGNVFVAGYTFSPDFPVASAFQNKRKGAIDAFISKFSTAEIGTLCGAVDNCDFTWATGGDAKWSAQTDTYYYDGDALQSGNIGDSQASYATATAAGPGLLSFRWLVSSASGDQLKFYIDNVEQTFIWGAPADWSYESYSIPEGTHTLKWSYEKNSYYSYGSDCGWLDMVEFSPVPEIALNRTQLTFGASGGSVTGTQTFSISNKTDSTLNWSVTADKTWMICSPTSGTDDGAITVLVDPSTLATGTYHGIISVTDPNAANSPQTVSVTLEVYRGGASSSPFGNYATPTDGSTISSSVPFTGWVLDDIGVESVKLYRQEGSGIVYIGDAVFVEGARPDVEAAYPNYPYNYKAGWGYMMLTNFLPNGGNGTFTVLAIATDFEGNQTTLGSKTVTVDNANAVKPFGAIDTPTQGGDASGNEFRNHGWVLTPLPNTVPIDGSTIQVFVDGVELGHAVYNIYRSDIASLFPGYSNSSGAHAYFDIDTTGYTNGIHSITWVATDDAGNADGIGSRYFMVRNSAESRLQTAGRWESEDGSFLSIIPIENSVPVRVKSGYSTDAVSERFYPDANGDVRVDTKELERVEFRFGGEKQITGYMVSGDSVRPLPPGSTLDSNNGIFRWQLGPAFVGEYQLVFIETAKNGNRRKRNIIVTVYPKHSYE